ncbi:MAG: hypothetical protein N3F10_04240 [Candidatus Bathyarchaeota archaeon]|nr:hypothetical protein [Candidatus Bathyarchaeota archaeon]
MNPHTCHGLYWEAVNHMDKEKSLERIREEFIELEKTMEEICFLKLVAQDLRSFRRMIRVKRYD